MEDRYLFRAKRDDNGEWVEGFLFLVNDVPYILPHHNTGQPIHGDNLLSVSAEVQKDTICRCTGYEGIYEKDIFRYEDEDYVIKWSDDSLSWEAVSLFTDVSVSLAEFNPDYIDVIGNEIDNPELLEV